MATILVVDDQKVNREFLVGVLASRGHRLLQAGDGAEALNLLRAQHPDLVISDIAMPAMDGYEFVRQLRADPPIAKTPVIFYTATYRRNEARALAHSCGVDHILTKPSEPEVIMRTVSEALEDTVKSPSSNLTPTFGRKHLQLLTNKLAQKVGELEMANSRLKTLAELGRELTLQLDPVGLIKTCCREARKLLSARYGAIGLLGDGQRLRHFIFSGGETQNRVDIPPPARDQGLISKLLTDQQPIRVTDIRRESGAACFLPPHPREGAFLGAAIASSAGVSGFIYFLGKLGENAFSDEDARVAIAVAAQMGIAYTNVRQYEDIQSHAAQLEAEIAERRRVEATLRESEERFRQLAEQIQDVVWVTDKDMKQVLYVNPGYETIWHRSCASLYGNLLSFTDAIYPEDQAKVLSMVESRKKGIYETEEYRIVRPDGAVRWLRDRAFPVRDLEGKIYRVAGVAEDITERKESEQTLHQYADRLQALSRRLLKAQETERRHLARELHDEIGQSLTAVKLSLLSLRRADDLTKLPERLDDSLGITEQALQKVRSLSLDLRPSILDDFGLRAALEWFVDQQVQRTGLTVFLDTNRSAARLPSDIETVCFRVVQEAFTNIARHARAARVWIVLSRRDDELILHISDDGVGFDVAIARARAARSGSLGLLGMQERVSLLGGKLEIDSDPGRGTELRAWFPLPATLPPV